MVICKALRIQQSIREVRKKKLQRNLAIGTKKGKFSEIYSAEYLTHSSAMSCSLTHVRARVTEGVDKKLGDL